ncbi:DUF998 domain-containing protein [Novosphingobium sp. SG707]|uniref:DUF998 domain-containing protein n=1 Tax=Novosphingobium sp. SG707 TaxID=2586996 RepID=UPI001444F194|nr:DUF998 domain-containing protein [Novosphingobium sp. SG707]NKJ01677.1 hypothetical protein [Novosphingobium sp. SG707]
MAESNHDGKHSGSTILPRAATGLFAYFLTALLLMHVIRPDYTVIDHMISDYAVGRFGWIMTTAFVALGAGCLTLALGLLRDGPGSWPGRIGAALLIVAFVGLLVTALYPTDLETAPSTRTGDIHAISFLVNIVSILLSTMCLAWSYALDPRWRAHRATALAWAGLLIAAFIAQYLTLHRGAPYGITNRFFVAVLIGWLMLNSRWLQSSVNRRSTSD